MIDPPGALLAASGATGVSGALTYGPGSYGVCAFFASTGSQSVVRPAPSDRARTASSSGPVV